MLIQLAADIRGYVYDVFVVRFDGWLVFGILAQAVFGACFVVQWLASERAGRSVIPLACWFLSIAGGLMTLVYGLVRREPVARRQMIWDNQRCSRAEVLVHLG